MKFKDSSFNDLKVTVGTKSVTHAPTHARTHARSESNMPHQLFQSWGHNNMHYLFFLNPLKPHFYYISTGLRGSVLHRDFSLMRFIANSSSCTTMSLSILLTSCLTAIKNH